MVALTVKQINDTALKIIVDFANSVERERQEELLGGVVEQADMALAQLRHLSYEFDKKIGRFGADEPPQDLDGHDFSIRVRCLGDGRDPNDCGRWFVRCIL